MSTKSTIILTKDNEHWYNECSQPRHSNGKFIGDDIVLEIDKKNIIDKYEDSQNLIITIRGDSNLAKQLSALSRSYGIPI